MVRVDIGKREAVFIVAVAVLILVDLGVTAFGTGDPVVFGHSGGEVNVNWSGSTIPLPNALSDSEKRIGELEGYVSNVDYGWIVGFDCDSTSVGDCTDSGWYPQSICNLRFPNQGYVAVAVDCATFRGIPSLEAHWMRSTGATGALGFCLDDNTPRIDLTVTCVDKDG